MHRAWNSCSGSATTAPWSAICFSATKRSETTSHTVKSAPSSSITFSPVRAAAIGGYVSICSATSGKPKYSLNSL